jgi:hypothetical protein
VGPPDAFTLAPVPATLTLRSGAHGVLTVAVASNPKFNDTLALGCAGLPAYATCTFSADRMVLTPGLPQSFSVTVDTGNPLGAGAAALLPLGVLMAWGLGRKRRRLALALVVGVIGLSVTGCATQFAQSTTPAGEYSFQIVGTGVGTGATETATVHLTVGQ